VRDECWQSRRPLTPTGRGRMALESGLWLKNPTLVSLRNGAGPLVDRVALTRPRRAQGGLEDGATCGAAQRVRGRVDGLNRARRLLVVFELVVDLQPIALGVTHDQTTVVCIEDHGRGESKPPFLLEITHFSAPSHRAWVGF
jgi:hypothetical protein